MSLVTNMMERCRFVERSRVPDGEGGYTVAWTDGAEFDAVIVRDTTMQARIAEASGVSSVYTVTVGRGVPVDFHDVFRRLRDGAIFRVTSLGSDKQTPDMATFQFQQVSAERWELPA